MKVSKTALYNCYFKLIIFDVGEVDRYLNFKMESGTSVYKSCTATMNGGTFVFGGHYDDNGQSNTRQVHFHIKLKMPEDKSSFKS